MHLIRFIVVIALAAAFGCDSMPLVGDSLQDELKITTAEGLLAQTVGKDHVLKVTVRDKDALLQQEARVLIDLGTGGTLVKMTDGQGEATFVEIELKKVVSIVVEKTERTRRAGD